MRGFAADARPVSRRRKDMMPRLLNTLTAVALLALAAVPGPAFAQESEPEPEPAAEEAAPAESPPPAPATPRTGVFIPTEKIPADAAISFPVDI